MSCEGEDIRSMTKAEVDEHLAFHRRSLQSRLILDNLSTGANLGFVPTSGFFTRPEGVLNDQVRIAELESRSQILTKGDIAQVINTDVKPETAL